MCGNLRSILEHPSTSRRGLRGILTAGSRNFPIERQVDGGSYPPSTTEFDHTEVKISLSIMAKQPGKATWLMYGAPFVRPGSPAASGRSNERLQLEFGRVGFDLQCTVVVAQLRGLALETVNMCQMRTRRTGGYS